MDSEGSAILNDDAVEIRNGVPADIHPIQHVRTGKRGAGIIVGKMARSLHPDNQESKFADFIRELHDVSSM